MVTGLMNLNGSKKLAIVLKIERFVTAINKASDIKSLKSITKLSVFMLLFRKTSKLLERYKNVTFNAIKLPKL